MIRSTWRFLFRASREEQSFPEACMSLKNRFRGRGQFRASQAEALTFLRDSIPADLDGWVNKKNACAALSVMSFFEVDHPMKAELAAWLHTRLPSMTPEEKLDASMVLLQADVNKFRDPIRSHCVVPLAQNADQLSIGQLSILVKVMQRCGGDTPPSAWEMVAEQVQRCLESGEAAPGDLVRFFSGFARSIPESPITRAILDTLIDNASSLKPFDYSTVVASVSKMHAAAPLELKKFRQLALQAAEYGVSLNCRDLGTILSCIMRMRASYKATPENVEKLWGVDNAIQVVLHTLKRVAIKFMDQRDSEKAWSSETDVVALVFAFESSGENFGDLFDKFKEFVSSKVSTIEGRNLALSLGILRRTGRLDDKLAARLSKRVGEVMDDFITSELSHVVFTYSAARGEQPPWIDRARARIATLLTDTTPAHARLNIQVAFPGETALLSNVDLDTISLRQLNDVLHCQKIDATMREKVKKALGRQLETMVAPNSAEVEVILNIGKTDFEGLGTKAIEAAERILSYDNWPVDVGSLATLFKDPKKRSEYVDKAVKSAAHYCGSVNQFVAFAGTLLELFPDHSGVREWVLKGANEMLSMRIPISTFITFLENLNHTNVELPFEWYHQFVYGPVEESFATLNLSSTLFLLQQLLKLPDPSVMREPFNALVQRASEIARTPQELAPAYVAAARFKGIPLDGDQVQKILQLGTLSPEERSALQAAERSPKRVFAKPLTQSSGGSFKVKIPATVKPKAQEADSTQKADAAEKPLVKKPIKADVSSKENAVSGAESDVSEDPEPKAEKAPKSSKKGSKKSAADKTSEEPKKEKAKKAASAKKADASKPKRASSSEKGTKTKKNKKA